MTDRKGLLAAITLILVASAWGATFALVKDVLRTIAPEPFIFLRFTIAGVLLVGIAAARGESLRAALRPGILLGLIVFAGYVAQTHGLMEISPSRSALLTGLYVVFTPFADRIVYRTRVSRHAWGSSVLALAGTVLLIGRIENGRFFGDAVTIFCAACFAFHVVLSARYSTKSPPTALAAVQVLTVGLVAAPFSLAAAHPVATPRLAGVILFTAIVTTALAFVALMWGQAHLSATQAAVILTFEPLAAAVISVAFYGERMTGTFLAGGAMILAAILLSQMPDGADILQSS